MNSKIILPGGAGLVGLNLIIELKQQGYKNIVVLDKHKSNIEIAKHLHPDIQIEYADLSNQGDWESTFENADTVVILQAQIGDLESDTFVKNNITSTENILRAIEKHKVPYVVHVSSSVVNSVANDDYTNTKRLQEKLIAQSQIPSITLRPTLMFGWFDRKHLGWLSRFMKKSPVFPIPGHGNYIRQPLYVRDFCKIIVSCIEKRLQGSYNISGFEKISYVDIIRSIKTATESKTIILKIPYSLFYILLKIWSMFDSKPPFTTDQLKALVAPDEFEIIDWPNIFGVTQTPWTSSIQETFNHPTYSKVTLNF